MLPLIRTSSRPVWQNISRLGHVTQQTRAQSIHAHGDKFWRGTPWKDVPAAQFNKHEWQVSNTVVGKKLESFLGKTLPDTLPDSKNGLLKHIRSKKDFIDDVVNAMALAPMGIRLTPYLLSRIDWSNPLDDPIRKQFIPLASTLVPDHEEAKMDSLDEVKDSPVKGLVHRYPGRALFIATSICPVYCRFCTRSYAVGENTPTVAKQTQKPARSRWEQVFEYIEKTKSLEDIVVSGGDSYYLQPHDITEIGSRLLAMDHIKRIRFATKGLAVLPCRIDRDNPWTSALINISQEGRKLGKQVCLHTHFNHPNEITWVTKNAANFLWEHGVTVRNQTVLLKDVNDDEETLFQLITTLANMNVQPYYVYQCDMVPGIEDLRTPLHELIKLDKNLRGRLAGFMTPAFVVDLPGGGGKRLVSTAESYENGVATYTAPGLTKGGKNHKKYEYHDPKPVQEEEIDAWNVLKAEALKQGITLKKQAELRALKARAEELEQSKDLQQSEDLEQQRQESTAPPDQHQKHSPSDTIKTLTAQHLLDNQPEHTGDSTRVM